MFARLFALLQLRRSTAFLLEREDDRLLDDIGLTRAELLPCAGVKASPTRRPARCASIRRRRPAVSP